MGAGWCSHAKDSAGTQVDAALAVNGSARNDTRRSRPRAKAGRRMKPRNTLAGRLIRRALECSGTACVGAGSFAGYEAENDLGERK
jgi:hypothetical protein